jgi:CubicO group peptidase (beta-lactamase class C family)
MKNASVISLFCFILWQTACSSSSLTTTPKEPSMRETRQQISDFQNEAQMPGLQVVVAEDGKPIFEYTSGIRAQGHVETVTPQDKWHIGSCTKPMTAFLIGRLVDEKRLDWKTRLQDIAPADVELDPKVKTITVEQLLSHNSGLGEITEADGGDLWPTLFTNEQSPQILRDKLVRAILKMPTRFEPGTEFEYSP